MEQYLLISEAAREVEVESHVLRYWEVELKLPIHRNEQGHRYYMPEDVERFKQIKKMKEKGLQLKAIKLILNDGNLNLLSGPEGEESVELQKEIPGSMEEVSTAFKEEKFQKLQWLLKQLISEAVRENNHEVCREIKESVVKELDFQFRSLEEREEERDARHAKRDEEYYKKVDDLLRKKTKKKRRFL